MKKLWCFPYMILLIISGFMMTGCATTAHVAVDRKGRHWFQNDV